MLEDMGKVFGHEILTIAINGQDDAGTILCNQTKHFIFFLVHSQFYKTPMVHFTQVYNAENAMAILFSVGNY